MVADGPKRIITLHNLNEKKFTSINWTHERTEIDAKLVPGDKIKKMEIYINLTGGIGVSLINWLKQEYEELVYCYLKSLELNFEQTVIEQKLLVNVQSIQVKKYFL